MTHESESTELNFDEFSEGRKSLESWQWDLIGGLVGIVAAFGVGWWVAGVI